MYLVYRYYFLKKLLTLSSIFVAGIFLSQFVLCCFICFCETVRSLLGLCLLHIRFNLIDILYMQFRSHILTTLTANLKVSRDYLFYISTGSGINSCKFSSVVGAFAWSFGACLYFVRLFPWYFLALSEGSQMQASLKDLSLL